MLFRSAYFFEWFAAQRGQTPREPQDSAMTSENGGSQQVGYRVRLCSDALRVYVPQRCDMTPSPVGADVGVIIGHDRRHFCTSFGAILVPDEIDWEPRVGIAGGVGRFPMAKRRTVVVLRDCDAGGRSQEPAYQELKA
ncbi:MAG: hypothetical protein PSV22_15275 [Pseudolabrys sp.]|nr:hypothetical protein [Pseudolabrys sp.]